MAGIPKKKEGSGEGCPSKENSEENQRPDLMRGEEKHEAKEVSSSGQSSPFVRNYRGKNSGGANPVGVNGAYRMSMTIRPQTVANLASKFDTIVKDQQPASKNSRQGGLKLRSYDITKIISELNKLNNEGGSDQSRVKSKPGKNENHSPCDGSSGGSSSGTPAGDNRGSGRKPCCGLGGDSSHGPGSHFAKTTASQPEAAAALRPTTLLAKTALQVESHNNRGARQDAVGPVGSCRLPGGGAASICENNLPPSSSSGRNADGSRSRCTSEEETTISSSLPAASSTSSLPASSLASSSSSRGRKESRKGLAVSFSPEQQVSYLLTSFLCRMYVKHIPVRAEYERKCPCRQVMRKFICFLP